jgi:hypothetical protein
MLSGMSVILLILAFMSFNIYEVRAKTSLRVYIIYIADQTTKWREIYEIIDSSI